MHDDREQRVNDRSRSTSDAITEALRSADNMVARTQELVEMVERFVEQRNGRQPLS